MGRGSCLILVVEDDSVIRAMVREALGDAGHRVAVAASFAEGVEALAHARFDLVLADAHLTDAAVPAGDAWAVVEHLKALAGYAPVVIFTANRRVFADYAARGFAELLLKPFDLDELLATVGRHLPRRGSGPA